MDKYYYIIAQLPMLFFDKESFMTIDIFLNELKKWLNPGDFQKFLQIELFDTNIKKNDPRILREYKQFESDFRNELALWRKSQKEGYEYKTSIFSAALVKEGNPFEIEKKILKRRWDFLEENEKEHHFDLSYLILYYLKLQILFKLSIFNNKKGLERFQEIILNTSFGEDRIKE
jgi:hypothetical protein